MGKRSVSSSNKAVERQNREGPEGPFLWYYPQRDERIIFFQLQCSYLWRRELPGLT